MWIKKDHERNIATFDLHMVWNLFVNWELWLLSFNNEFLVLQKVKNEDEVKMKKKENRTEWKKNLHITVYELSSIKLKLSVLRFCWLKKKSFNKW